MPIQKKDIIKRNPNSGLYEYRFTYKDPISGKRKERSKEGSNGFKTWKLADADLTSFKSSIHKGIATRDDKMKIGRYFDIWFENHKTTLKPSTIYRVAGQIEILKKEIGYDDLVVIDYDYVQTFYNKLAKRYTYETLKGVIALFKMMVKQAIRARYFTFNPLEGIKIPKLDHKEKEKKNFWTKAEVSIFIKSLQFLTDIRYIALFYLFIYSGLRFGEATSLKWSDIDFENKTVSVKRSRYRIKGVEHVTKPKTKASIRTVPVPDVVIDYLKKWRIEQKQIMMANRKTYDNQDYIFTNDSGGMVVRKSVYWQFGKVIKYAKSQAKIKTISIHGLRHTYCMLCRHAGIDVKEAQRRMGHSKIQTTLEVYSHHDEDTISKGVNQFDSLVSTI